MTPRRIFFAIVIVILLLFVTVALGHFFGWSENISPPSPVSRIETSIFSDVKRIGAYPDPSLTPGAIDSMETKEKVCTPNHTKKTRHVTIATKREVFRRYGLSYDERGEDVWEVDHFIPLALGGANVLENLWPEPADPRPGFREKDIVEVYLHREVCRGAISLPDAQEAIRKDWYAVYEKWCAKRKEKRKACVKEKEAQERIQ